eukprot:TRINITY_DN9229_c0_g2_i3.p1 TRINITY_DN9229_c0_g2~~TRINITY_DN9229_c0_g2_i3.p1  ORF type:complete len:429 (+),score=82.70 TRINITY_DN9229_c0_g2_i3:15-1301(+)
MTMEAVVSTQSTGELLIKYYRSGDEEDFKSHSREWLKMKNPNVEYTAGFIEYYDDPMSHVGTYQSDVTVKSLKLDSLLQLLPSFEQRFPFPDAWKRKDMSVLPNAATVHKVMGLGGLGPLLSTIAYCLPNYHQIRSELGSKQVMYTLPPSLDLERYKTIYFGLKQKQFFDRYSPDLRVEDIVSSLCTTLHETIGHASGSSVEGITDEMRNERIGKWLNGLEEMRAEILALFTGTHFYSEIVSSGILEDWPNKISKEDIFTLMIDDIAGGGWKRWRLTPEGSMEIEQAHALADTGIMYYLIDHSDGGILLTKESVAIDGEELTCLRLEVVDISKVLPVIRELAIKVQKLSSEAVFEDIDKFMNDYAVSTRDPTFSGIVRKMRAVSTKGVLMRLQVFPQWEEVEGDVVVRVPNDPIENSLDLWNLSQRVW